MCRPSTVTGSWNRALETPTSRKAGHDRPSGRSSNPKWFTISATLSVASVSHFSVDSGDRPRSGLDEDAVINAVERDTGNKLDGSELCRPPSMLREFKLAMKREPVPPGSTRTSP